MNALSKTSIRLAKLVYGPSTTFNFSTLNKEINLPKEVSQKKDSTQDSWENIIGASTKNESRTPKNRLNKMANDWFSFEHQISEAPTDLSPSEIQQSAKLAENQAIPVVPWFPTKITELDNMGGHLIDTAEVAGKDHPSFTDSVYRKRRDEIANNSKNTKINDLIPILDYTESELGTWKAIFRKIVPMHKQFMCKQYLDCFEKLQKNIQFDENNIPQLREISEYLKTETRFRVKVVHGNLSQREFLNAFAFRTFCCTQYIRHHEFPFYTPEPDVVHELLGHVPMLADQTFCDISHMIGLLSLGASEEDLVKLAAIYWYTVECGACKEGDKVKVYGAAVASSIDEMTNFISGKAKLEEFDAVTACLKTNYPYQSVQPLYMVAKSFEDAKNQLFDFGRHLQRPFKTIYNEKSQEIKTDRIVKMRKPEENLNLF